MHLINKIIKENKSAIVLVPEISLTTQLIDRFRSIFLDNIAVLHSSLSDGERYDEWRRIYKRDPYPEISAGRRGTGCRKNGDH